MAVALLVIGALMSGAGIYAVVFGYSMIQVEEGWASVISGATLIAGGVVTIALGLVLRVLKQVQVGLLETQERVAPEMTKAAADPLPSETLAVAAVPEPTVADATPPLVSAEPSIATRDEQPVAAPAALPDILHEARVPPTTEALPHQPPLADTFTKPLSQAEPEAERARASDDYKLETPSTAEHDLLQPDPHDTVKVEDEPASPAMDDWLDRAFAELDRDNPPWPPRRQARETRKPAFEADDGRPEPSPAPQPAPLEPAVAAHAGDQPASGETAPAVAEPAGLSTQSAPTPSAGAPSQSAVIGRYESDGTTYVMFADGSIEAQSAAGIYRFASMAELKRYIEK